MDTSPERFHPTPHLPTYHQARKFIIATQGLAREVIAQLRKKIYDQLGTPQDPVDWTKPDKWIPERLSGRDRDVASRIWIETDKLVNPRHISGCWWLIHRYNLMSPNTAGLLTITPDGQDYIENPTGNIAADIDYKEGMLTILQLVSEHSPAQRQDILPGYIEFCLTYTTWQAPYVHRTSITNRFLNLTNRRLLERHGILYEVTELGRTYLKEQFPNPGEGRTPDIQAQLKKIAQNLSQTARSHLKDYLRAMDPYKFEHLIKLLLDEMGYTGVDVTVRSGDGGVDVIGDIELGITSVHEVVQVKRHSGNIGPNIVNQLRGTLPHFGALRGTIITTSAFTDAAKQAAFVVGGSPITLIDGKKLLDLLIQYHIGVKQNQVEFIEFDPESLRQFAADEEQDVE